MVAMRTVDDDSAAHDVVAESVKLRGFFDDPILDRLRPVEMMKADLEWKIHIRLPLKASLPVGIVADLS
jgi:hypothetical protein